MDMTIIKMNPNKPNGDFIFSEINSGLVQIATSITNDTFNITIKK
jgi:hypothetical protein